MENFFEAKFIGVYPFHLDDWLTFPTRLYYFICQFFADYSEYLWNATTCY